ncbi:hypothetical protein PQS90_12295 [Pseudomonas sp. BLCC-B13]|uniref:hypothetical protein n=1 Tax=Pseudomonas sp. BLCC-B13 TaxID=3025314 RepID=UPI00234EF70B|nr:hypothetical protein [Pseudomonas sp. BLCC-B13]MDC7825929.1 hypothetical protein [Pseudomonas sp. BLCC-B13]
MRRRLLLWAAATLSLMGLSALLGWHAARWQAGLTDLLCAGDFRDYRVGVALEDGAGITLPAGTRLRLRFCEYNAQAQLELLIDKGEFDQLQPLAHPAAERWLYSLQPVSEGER